MSSLPSWAHLAPILLLCASNLFMTFAWYGHLRFRSAPLPLVILVSWGIAFVEGTVSPCRPTGSGATCIRRQS